MSRYSFQYSRHDPDNAPHPEFTESQKTVEFSDDVDPWTPVLYEFCTFLSGIYGYNITEKVFVEQFNFNTGEADLVSLAETL
jgi:hypothetical protein